MCAAARDAPVVKDDDLVRADDGVDALGDDQLGHARQRFAQRAADGREVALRGRIDDLMMLISAYRSGVIKEVCGENELP